MSIENILNEAPENIAIFDSLLITDNKLKQYDQIMVSISGGWDSDILLDICTKVDFDNKITYVFFDTGLEYAATKRHLNFLENKYGIKILREPALKPIPTCCRQYGQPFLSKQVSEWISRLQRHNFKWEDKSLDELLIEYSKCKAALRWWCNDWGEKSKFNISYTPWLKEFMIENPPDFQISNMCCTFAKKLVAKKFKEDNRVELSITGVRKSEGGARATAYKNCFTSNVDNDVADEYRAIFWYKNEDKIEYDDHYKLCHSDCYTKYGLSRTGCAGCPYSQDFENELLVIAAHEPKFFNAVNKIFGKSYEYTRKFREFQRMKKNENI